eukprot:889177-Rhodomonas_salina.1
MELMEGGSLEDHFSYALRSLGVSMSLSLSLSLCLLSLFLSTTPSHHAQLLTPDRATLIRRICLTVPPLSASSS